MEAPSLERIPSHTPGLKLAWLTSSLMGFLGLFSPNPLVTAVAAFLPVVLTQLLWRSGEPQVLLLALWMQSIQVIAPVWVFNREDVSMASIFNSAAYPNAFYFSVLALISFALAARLGAGSSLRLALLSSDILEDRLNSRSLFQCYGLFLFVQLATPFIVSQAGGLAQLVWPLASIRLIFAYYIFKSSIRKKKISLSLLVILLVETMLGFTGFFADFKNIFLVIVLAALSVESGLRTLFRKRILVVILLFLFLLSYWQYVKPSYRFFVSLGSASQVVSVSLSERLDFHLTALRSIKPEHLELGFNNFLERAGYLKFFAGTIQHVPTVVPHQGGRLWSEAVEFSLKPRVLFPSKAVANDSDRTNTFSGMKVAGISEGTSVSIGYVGESYIDFGFPFMLAPVAAMGWLLGRLYRLLILIQPINPLNCGAAIILILNTATTFETSNLKLLPAALLSFIVYWFLLKLVQQNRTRLWAWLAAS